MSSRKIHQKIYIKCTPDTKSHIILHVLEFFVAYSKVTRDDETNEAKLTMPASYNGACSMVQWKYCKSEQHSVEYDHPPCQKYGAEEIIVDVQDKAHCISCQLLFICYIHELIWKNYL